MHPARRWNIFLYQSAKSRPCHSVVLAASAQLTQPRTADYITETSQPCQVVRHRVIVEVAAYDPFQPSANLTNRLVSLPYQLLPNDRKRCSQPLLDRQSQYLEASLAGLRAAVRETKKIESSRPRRLQD